MYKYLIKPTTSEKILKLDLSFMKVISTDMNKNYIPAYKLSTRSYKH
jgi:hypothetical protein